MDEFIFKGGRHFKCPCSAGAWVMTSNWSCGVWTIEAKCLAGHSAYEQIGWGCEWHPCPVSKEDFPGLLAAAWEATETE